MWSEFYHEGGWGMYPTSLFGFILVAVSVLYLLRPEPRWSQLALTLGVLTLSAGLLGTSTGICNTARYVLNVPQADQVKILAIGCQESLHNLVLALIFVVLGGLAAAVGVLRSTAPRRDLTSRAPVDNG